MANIYDIAKESGYSIATVSKVLNDKQVSEKARKRVLDAVEKLSYTPNLSARTLATNKSWMIGVVFSEDLGVGIAHPFFSEVIEAFKQHVERYNYDLLFLSRHRGLEKETYKHLLRRGVDGVIIVQSFGEDYDQNSLGIPAVFADRPSEDPSSVHSDNINGSILAVNYLVKQGHKNIAHIRGDIGSFASIQRLAGYKQAMTENSLPIKEEYISNGGYFSFDGGKKAMHELLALGDIPTAVVVAGDEMALGAMKAIREHGLSVPEDVSIIGFDDIAIAKHVDPPLTTIKQDKQKIGQEAAIMLLQKINGEVDLFTEESKVIPVELIERESCRKI